MGQDIVVSNLREFGSREIAMAGKLLTAYVDYDEDPEGDGELKLYMNRNSGYVFLAFEFSGDVLMMNGNDIEIFYTCPVCGHEGFMEDMEHNEDREECQEYMKEIKERQNG